MASTTRTFARAFARQTSSLRVSSARLATPSQTVFRAGARRAYSSQPPKQARSTGLLIGAAVLALGGASAAYSYSNVDSASKVPEVFKPTQTDYQKVYDAIAKELVEKDDYDDGSYGPVLVRLAWHASGTFDAETGTGGSNGATMRFAPEGDHGANAGLKAARDFLEPIKGKFPWITYSDLWTLAGVAAIQEMQGPIIPWRPGRVDRDVSFCTPDGRLPDASKRGAHLRDIFYRMGFDDREIVALSGAHALGRCHPDRSGFDGPWDFSPTTMTNEYFKLLVNEKWEWRKWNGPKQYTDKTTKTLMMLPSDMALVEDKVFKPHVQRYAADVNVFFKEFSDVICKLFELGVPFTQEERFTFKPSE